MDKVIKIIDYLAPILLMYPKWAQWLFIVTIALFALSLVVFLVLLPSAKARLDSKTQGTEISKPSVVIEGPPTAPLGKTTYYTITSQNTVRGIWSVGGFHNEPIVVEPLGPSHQIFIEPTDATRVGDSFTIVFTVYDANGNKATATKRFMVVSD